MVDHVKEHFGVSERRACRVLGHPRSTQRYAPRPVGDEKALTEAVVELATQFGRYGYRRITALLRHPWLASEPQACGEDMAA